MVRAIIEESIISDFIYRIFRLLDLLGHFPISLRGEKATPTKLEKYPRLLFGYLQQYEDPVVAYKEWESKVLRDTPEDDMNYKKNKVFPYLEETLNWLSANRDFFHGKDKKLVIQHLRGSLYARIFAYLYPRRQLCSAVAQHLHLQNRPAVPSGQEFEILAGSLYELDEIRRIFYSEWPVILADARSNFEQAAGYYQKIIFGKPGDEKKVDRPENTQDEND